MFLSSDITNGDKIVFQKLDSQILLAHGDDRDSEDIDDKNVCVNFHDLVHKGSKMDNILKDLLDLPLDRIVGVLDHPVMMLFIEKRWQKTKWMFCLSFMIYLIFLMMFSTFLGLMYFRKPEHPSQALLIPRDNQDGNMCSYNNNIKKNFARVMKKRSHSATFFTGCYPHDEEDTLDPPLCSVEILLFISIGVVFLQQVFEFIALGRRHFQELESWFKILIFSLALTAMFFEEHLEILNVVASAAICLSWIEIIFMIGRYPFLGGKFSIMFYAITKRIIQGAISFIIIIIAFGFAFFIISLGSGGEQFQNPWKSLLKIIVMILGEFEFDTLYQVNRLNLGKLSTAMFRTRIMKTL